LRKDAYPEAEKLIKENATHPRSVKSYIKIPVGRFWTCHPRSWATSGNVKRAFDEGLLAFEVAGNKRSDNGYQRVEIASTLTPAGEALVAARSEARLQDDPDIVYFRACEIEFAGVTGITTARPPMLSTKNATPDQRRGWRHDDGKCTEGKTLKYRARFRKYDDGWRLWR
jgi:hypothetical protein